MKSFFSRFFTTHLFILLLSITAISLFSILSMKHFLYQDNLERQMEFTKMVVHFLEQADWEEGNETEFLRRISRDGFFRITLIRRDGSVIADTDVDYWLMDNHANRPEIRQAYASGNGDSRRVSSTIRETLLYTAIFDDRSDLVIRVSTVVSNLDRMVAKLAFRVGLIALVVLMVALLISFRQTHSVNRMLKSIVSVVSDYAHGDFQQNLYLGGFHEAIEVGDAVNSMGRQLQEKIETITFQKNKSEAMLSNMVEPVLYLDSNLMINDINQAALRMANCTFNKCLGKNLLQIIRNIELCRLAENCLKEKTPMSTVIKLLNHHYMVQATIIEQGDDWAVLLVLNDVTDIKQMELMRKDFVANVSHELRTPITSIIGFVETLRSMPSPLTDQQSKFLEIIQSQSRRLGEIVNDLLSLASLDEESRTFNKEIVRLSEVVEEAESVCRMKAEERRISFEHDFDPELTLCCHRHLTEQALVNYLDNAVKYGPGDSSVTIRARREGKTTVLSVIDRGNGIDEEQQERLFERFYRVDKARSREIGGTGLGLAIVKHIALKHGGRAGVESRIGEGSRFFITFSHCS